jgi:hypothetical protein
MKLEDKVRMREIEENIFVVIYDEGRKFDLSRKLAKDGTEQLVLGHFSKEDFEKIWKSEVLPFTLSELNKTYKNIRRYSKKRIIKVMQRIAKLGWAPKLNSRFIKGVKKYSYEWYKMMFLNMDWEPDRELRETNKPPSYWGPGWKGKRISKYDLYIGWKEELRQIDSLYSYGRLYAQCIARLFELKIKNAKTRI